MQIPRSIGFAATGIVCLLTFVTTAAAEDVDNPQYESWARFKAGTTVTYSRQESRDSLVSEGTSVYTLVESSPTGLTIEITTTLNSNGVAQVMPAFRVNVPPKIEKGQENMPLGSEGVAKAAQKATLELGGKKYQCQVYEFAGDRGRPVGAGPWADPVKDRGTLWLCDEIPGGMAMISSEYSDRVYVGMKMTSFDAK